MVIYDLFDKLMKRYSEKIVLRVIKPLYDLSKARNHWFATYLNHYKEKLQIKISFYNKFLLIIQADIENFGIKRLQTDNILTIKTEIFMNKKEAKIAEAKFKAKS